MLPHWPLFPDRAWTFCAGSRWAQGIFLLQRAEAVVSRLLLRSRLARPHRLVRYQHRGPSPCWRFKRALLLLCLASSRAAAPCGDKSVST